MWNFIQRYQTHYTTNTFPTIPNKEIIPESTQPDSPEICLLSATTCQG
jgi:hypothetical protein